MPGAHGNTDIVRRLWDVWTSGDLDPIDELVDDDFTNLGEFRAGTGLGRITGAMPPTGRTFAADQSHIYRLREGKVVEHAARPNDLLLSQLSLVPGAFT